MWVGRIARQLGWGRNPLRRRSDRIEIGVTLMLVLAMVVLCPWVGRHAARFAYRDVVRTNAWEQLHRFPVDAVLTGSASPGPEAGEPGAPVSWPAQARWIAPDGSERTGTIDAGVGRRVGDTVPVWVNDRGEVVSPPRHSDPRHSAVIAFVLVVGAVSAGLLSLHRILRRRLDRCRLCAWQTEWAVIGPLWSRRR